MADAAAARARGVRATGDDAGGALAAQAYEAAARARPRRPARAARARRRGRGRAARGRGRVRGGGGGERGVRVVRDHAARRLRRCSSGGRALDPPAGRPSTLVKLLALAEQPLRAEEAIEALWPDVDESTGRQRLRNLLNRLRTSCGELVQRDGETLVLGAGRGRRARLRARRGRGARRRGRSARAWRATALARYKGELLPGDRYEAWATAPRERLQRRYLELLDLLAEDAVERGDVDEAIRLLDQAQVAEPLDEDRYLRAAELLLFQGRRGSAQSLVDRAAAVRERARAGGVGAVGAPARGDGGWLTVAAVGRWRWGVCGSGRGGGFVTLCAPRARSRPRSCAAMPDERVVLPTSCVGQPTFVRSRWGRRGDCGARRAAARGGCSPSSSLSSVSAGARSTTDSRSVDCGGCFPGGRARLRRRP